MSRRRRALLAALAALAAVPVIVVAVIFAVGDSQDAESAERDSALTEPAPEPAPPPPSVAPAGDPVAGREVFLAQGCGNCHTLAAAGTSGTIGPALDASTPSYERFLEQVTIGGGGMPSFEGIITPREIEDVVAFVIQSIRR